jgi:hypothetical protein
MRLLMTVAQVAIADSPDVVDRMDLNHATHYNVAVSFHIGEA